MVYWSADQATIIGVSTLSYTKSQSSMLVNHKRNRHQPSVLDTEPRQGCRRDSGAVLDEPPVPSVIEEA